MQSIKSIRKIWLSKYSQSNNQLLPESYSAEDALRSVQALIREWLKMYSFYPQEVEFGNALKLILGGGKHTAEQIQAVIPTLLAGPQQHSSQAKNGWKNKVVLAIKTLQDLLAKQK